MRFIEYGEIEIGRLRQRLSILSMIVIVLFGILILRIGYLQIIKGSYYKKISEHNRIRLIPIPASRGMIFDRNGKLLVRDIPSFNISMIQLGLSKETIEQTLNKLSKIIIFDFQQARKSISDKITRPFEPAVIAADVQQEIIAQVAERISDLPGIIIQVIPKRSYVQSNLFSHILGYLGEINKKELKDKQSEGYKYGDLIGKSGIEKSYNSFLQGKNGGKQIEVDVRGNQLRVLGEIEPVPGNNLILSIDTKLQQAADEALGDKNGAVVVLNPRNGEILALVSKPTFDVNIFLNKMSHADAKKIFTDKNYPLLNRTIQARYAPGSVFKIIVATCALENNLITNDETIFCDGIYLIGKQRFICFQKEKHFSINIVNALAHSCNIFFYQLGIRVGIDRLSNFAKKLGFGELTGIDLPNEKSGFVPTRSWKKRVLGEEWYSGETANLSIGQGYMLVTPLQMANSIASIVNGGTVFIPQVVKKIIDSSGNVTIFNADVSNKVLLSNQTRQIINEGLEAVISRGTGVGAYIPWLKIGGKTGTVQNPRGEDHAWFVCYAPVDNPEVVISVIVEHGGKGGLAAAPIVREILLKMDWNNTRQKTENTKQPVVHSSQPVENNEQKMGSESYELGTEAVKSE